MTKIIMATKGVIRDKGQIKTIETRLTPEEVVNALKEFESKKGRRSDDK